MVMPMASSRPIGQMSYEDEDEHEDEHENKNQNQNQNESGIKG